MRSMSSTVLIWEIKSQTRQSVHENAFIENAFMYSHHTSFHGVISSLKGDLNGVHYEKGLYIVIGATNNKLLLGEIVLIFQHNATDVCILVKKSDAELLMKWVITWYQMVMRGIIISVCLHHNLRHTPVCKLTDHLGAAMLLFWNMLSWILDLNVHLIIYNTLLRTIHSGLGGVVGVFQGWVVWLVF